MSIYATDPVFLLAEKDALMPINFKTIIEMFYIYERYFRN